MPRLIDQDPDCFDLDYFHNKYSDRYGAMMRESNINEIKVMPFAFNPSECSTKKKEKEKVHYFHIPTEPAIVQCLCHKYHTFLTSSYLNVPPRQATPPPTTSQSMDIDMTPSKFKKIKDTIPNSPTKKLAASIPPFPLNYFATHIDTSMLTTSSTQQSELQVQAHSHHVHTCIICKQKNIPCVFLIDDKHALIDKTTLNIQGFPAHLQCIHKLKLQPAEQQKPLTCTQRATFYTIAFLQMNKANKKEILAKFCKLLPKKQQQQQQQQKQQQQQQQKRDTTNDLDWFKAYPITPAMEPFTKFNTPLAQQIFEFMKPHLIDFAPGKVRNSNNSNQQQESNTNNPTQQKSKHTFKYLLKSMTGLRPNFLTEITYQHNPSMDKKLTIPFDILYTNFKIIVAQFTEVLFTKLNYSKIFTLHNSIPPYNINNRCNIALNFARLHLFLHDKYQTINRAKFINDLNLHPLRLKLNYFISQDKPDQPLFKIQNDQKFNINVSLNIPEKRFQEDFRIPALKTHKIDLDTWFKTFIQKYKRQFEDIDEQKVYNYINFNKATELSKACKRLLPKTFTISSINSFEQRQRICTKAALYHIHTCMHNDKNPCSTLEPDTEHNFKNIMNLFWKQSFNKFPAPEKVFKSFIEPKLDESIFYDKDNAHYATFQKLTPINQFHKLAAEAEQYFTKKNDVPTSKPRQGYYFYEYFKLYQLAAANNDNITDLTQEQAIEQLTKNPIDTDYLARVLTYYYASKKTKFTIAELRKIYNTTFYPQAQKILNEKFKIKFSLLTHLEPSTLFKTTTSTPKQDVPNTSEDTIMENSNDSSSYSKVVKTKTWAETLQSQTPETISFNPFQ
jgi:hypothetical protein